jgi:hypothetical protein
VKFWHPDWQKLILQELLRIQAVGFDGIYLDIVDAFEFFEYDPLQKEWRENLSNPETSNSYRQDMIAWVTTIAAQARKQTPGFLVVPQNGSQLLADPAYARLISGIGIEDLFTDDNHILPLNESAERLETLRPFAQSGKPVFVIEYASTFKAQHHAVTRAALENFELLLTHRDLNHLGWDLLPPENFDRERLKLQQLPARDGGSVWHVDALRGDNQNPGSQTRPLKSIQAAADRAQPGDCVLIAPGLYPEVVRPARSGSAESPIRYQARSPGTVVLDGQNRLPGHHWDGLFILEDRHHIEIIGLRFRNSTAAGLYAKNSSHLLIQANESDHTWSSGIQIWNSQNIRILGNTVRRTCQGVTPKGTGTQECITLASCTDSEIAWNRVYDRRENHGDGGEGIDVKQACHNVSIHHNLVHDLIRLGIYVDAYDKTAGGIQVHDNVVSRCASGIVLSAEMKTGELTEVLLSRNILYRNRNHGIEVSDYEDDAPRRNLRIDSNHAFANGRPDWGGGISILTRNPKSGNVLIESNHLHANHAWQLCGSTPMLPKITLRNNTVQDVRGYDGGTEKEIH